MVNDKKMMFLTLFLLGACSFQSQGRTVSSLSIHQVGLDDDGGNENEKRACKTFRPNKQQMILFFNHAKESKDDGTLLHEYDSPCLAKGKVKFKDGASGRWTVQSSGLGWVFFDNGKSATFFLKGNKWDDPFACSYGLGDDLIC